MSMTFGTPEVGTLVTQVVATKGTAAGEQGTFAHGLGVIPELVLVSGLADGSGGPSNPELGWSISSVDNTNVIVEAPTTTGTDAATAQVTIFKTIHTLIG